MKTPLTRLSVFICTALTSSVAQAGPNPQLDKIFTFDMIYADVAYLEQFTGVPRSRNNHTNSREYRVGKCKLNAYIKENQVESLEILNVSNECTFDLGKMVPCDSVPDGTYVHKLTYGKTDGGEFSSDCFYGCSAVFNSNIYMSWGESRCGANIEIKLGTEIADDKSVNAHFKLKDYIEMKQEKGEDPVGEVDDIGEYTLKNHEDHNMAYQIFKDIPITYVRVGYGIIEWDNKD